MSDHPSPFLAALERLGPSDHLCMSYGTSEEQLEAVIPFLRYGLERRERCVYIADDGSRAALLSALQAAGIAVGDAAGAGVLSVLGKQTTYLRDGRFEPERMLAWIAEQTEAALVAGFQAFRLAGEMTCVRGTAPGVERLAEYEAKLNQLLPTRPVSALCTYDRRRFPADIVREGIATHPLVVVGRTVCRNPYFAPPEKYLSPEWQDNEVEWVLENILALQRAEDELRESKKVYRTLAQRLLEAQETERRAIARELHDELGQILTTVTLSLKAASKSRPVGRAKRLAEAVALVGEAIERIRTVVLDLRPAVLDDLGLAAALEWYVDRQAKRTGLDVHLDMRALEGVRLLPAVETACFRVVQEAFTNIVRHAGARHVDVQVSIDRDALELVIRDDGVGFDVARARQRAAAGASLGFLSMEERFSLAGGQLTIESTPGAGTTIRGRLPLPPGSGLD
jgi:signal transduction histidine kinase